MDWSNEPYVRVYTRDTDDDLVLSWEARAVWDRLLRRFDRSGFFETKRGPTGVAAAVLIPLAVVDRVLPELLRDGRLVEVEGGYIAPNFVDAQTATKSDKLRQREQRDRRRARNLDRAVGTRDAAVTRRDETVATVTLTSADPDPLLREPPARTRSPEYVPEPQPLPPKASLPEERDLVPELEQTLEIAKRSQGPAAVGPIAKRLYDRLSDARVTLGKRFGITPEPLPFPPVGLPSSRARGWLDLKARLAEEGEHAELVAERVYEHLVKQAEEQRSVDWLSEKAFTAGAWQTAREGRGARRDNVIPITNYPQTLRPKHDEDAPPPLPRFLRDAGGKPA